jgi:hypothetical protein
MKRRKIQILYQHPLHKFRKDRKKLENTAMICNFNFKRSNPESSFRHFTDNHAIITLFKKRNIDRERRPSPARQQHSAPHQRAHTASRFWCVRAAPRRLTRGQCPWLRASFVWPCPNPTKDRLRKESALRSRSAVGVSRRRWPTQAARAEN